MTHSHMEPYRVVEEEGYDPAIGVYRTYAIQATPEILVHDVSTDRQVAEQMARLFTQHLLDPIHLHDAVEDFMP